MKKIPTGLDDVFIIEPQVFNDGRGWFMETYNDEKFRRLGINAAFVQDNHSYSAKKGVLRGLHFQKNPYAQSKLVRCTRGSIFDVAVDIRAGSPQYLKWTAVELSAENKLMLYIPRGFAHGFLTLTDDGEVQYKVDRPYAPEFDMSIAWNDAAIGIEWGTSDPVLSPKDINASPIGNEIYFRFGEDF